MKNTNKYKLNIKTMKKGLLTLLAASLVFVGCQNYDDQFDDLNAQISALKSQVDGLAALSGQVASLSSTISGIQAGVTAAQAAASSIDLSGLEASLASLAAEVAEIEADLANAATTADITALQADLADVDTQLQEILDGANIYQDNIVIGSVNNLDTFEDLGSNINIVNGNVTITKLAAMDNDVLQAVIDNIFTINGKLTVTDIAGTATNSFDKLTSVQDIEMDNVDGALSFATLTTAEAIDIDESEGDHDDDADTANAGMMTSLSMPLLTSATSIDLGGANTIDLGDSGTSVNINSLPAFGTVAGGQTALTINTADGGSLTAGALTTPLDGDDEENFTLTLHGLASFTAPAGVDGGSMVLSEVTAVTVGSYQGDIDVNTGVETLTATAVDVDLAGADDLISATITGIAKGTAHDTYDADDVTAQGEGLGSITLAAANADLTSLTLAGNLNDVTIDDSALVSLTISATMDVLDIATSDDLTTLDVSDATIGDIIINDNDAITSITLDNATNLAYTGTATALTGTQLDVTGNADLESLTVSLGSLDDIDIDVNASLSTLDFSGVTTIGAGANVSITGNDLDAESITETDASETEGSIDDGTSGMSTLTGLMAALTAQTAAVATIRFDSAQTITEEAGEVNNGGDVNYGDADDDLLDIYVKAAGSAGSDEVAANTYTAVVGVSGAGVLELSINGVDHALGTMVANTHADNVATVLASAGIDTALGADAVVSAKRGYNSSSSVTISLLTAGYSGLYGERYNTAAAVSAATTDTSGVYGIGVADEFTLTVGDTSVTATFAAEITTPASIIDYWDTNWPADSMVTLSQLGASGADQLGVDIVAVASALDSSAYDLDVSVTITDSTTGSTMTGAAIDYIIGATRGDTDNKTADSGILVTIASTQAGATNNTIVSAIAAGGNNAATLDILTAGEAQSDWVAASDTVAAVASASGVTTDLSSWL